jgi:hypothetical protein
MVRPRGGRGNLAPYETKLIRVPIPIEEQVQELISRYHHWMSLLDEVPDGTPNLLDKAVNNLEEQLEKIRAAERDAIAQVISCHSEAFRASDILRASLKLPANAGGKIKTEIRKALELIDDV